MKNIAFQTLVIGALAAGLLLAQGPGFGRRGGGPQAPQFQNQQMDPQQFAEWRVNRLAFMLNLNETQKTQAKSIFEQMFKSTQALQADVLKAREALQAAIKAYKVDQISTLSVNLGALTTKIRTIHAVAQAEFYSKVLLPAQREQLDKLGGFGMGMGGNGRGRGMGMNCPLGARP